ncbi:polysaccharide biosynthesis tyrosine autokinase [Microbaculum marinum]|uniref:Polysaccharide biosynthesis tyrosine autokinase n=1 Tax=Microbaculum marinum TaxID=1764581 RepID=A0AAW9RY11_9HYPH
MNGSDSEGEKRPEVGGSPPDPASGARSPGKSEPGASECDGHSSPPGEAGIRRSGEAEEHAAWDHDATAGPEHGSSGRGNGQQDDWTEGPARRNGGNGAPRDARQTEEPALPSPVGKKALVRRETLPDAYAPQSAYFEQPGSDIAAEFRKYLGILLKHRLLIIGVVFVVVTGGLIYTLLVTPIYRASTTIQISRELPKIMNVEGVQAIDGARDLDFYQTQFEILRSRSMAERVVAEGNLADDTAFLKTETPSPWAKLLQIVFGGADDSPMPSLEARKNMATWRVIAGMRIDPIRSSSLVRLSFDSPDPAVAQRVVNAIADGYIAANLDRRYEASTYARKFLEDRLKETKLKLEESEKELVRYAGKEQIVNTSESQTLAMTNLSAANDALTEISRERLRNELTWRQLQSKTDLGLSPILESESLEEMRLERAALVAEYQNKLSVYKPAFPEMLKLQAQIDELARQIDTEVSLIKESAKARYEASVEQEQALQQQVDALKSEVLDFRDRSIQYTILQREVDTNRALYDALLQRYKEIGVAGGVGTNNISVVDYAQLPGAPYTPNMRSNLIRALMLGLLFGGMAAFAREYLDDTFKSPEDVEDNLALPLLGVVPATGRRDTPIDLLEDPRSAVSEAFRSLRTALQFSTASGVPRSLLVTSSRASEGKSTTAFVLARYFAHLGMRVLLIDADLRKPTLHRHMESEETAGLTNCLAGSMRPPDVLLETDLPTLTFMPCGPLPPNPAELLASPKMLSLLSVACEKYELVVIDGPPVAGLADAPLLASIAEGTLLVVEANGTRRSVAKSALKRLYFARAQMLGVLLNKFDIKQAGYTYGYGYGYGDTAYYGYGVDPQGTLPDARES